MKINKEQEVTVNISVNSYATKPVGQEISGMVFKKETLTICQLVDLLKEGHSFCPLFGNLEKRGSKETWTGSPFICVDIDDTMYEEIPDFVCLLKYRPTFVYPSYSDGLMKNGKTSRRFHLVYFFETPLDNPEIFKGISCEISREIETNTSEEISDKTWIDRTRYFNGVICNNDYYILGNIYTPEDFTIPSSVTSFETGEHLEKTSIQELIKIREDINRTLLKDIDKLDHDRFYHFWGPRLKYIYESEDTEPGVEDFYKVTGDSYFKIPFWKTRKLDGSHRRIWVYTRMCLRRVMCPEIDINTLIYCAYQDVYFSVDNSDGVFNSEYYERNALAAFEYTIEATEKKFQGLIDYYRENSPKIRTIPGRLQEARFLEYDKNGIPEDLSRTTDYRYRKSRGLIQKTDYTDMMTHYDESKSLRVNLSNLKSLGYKISLGKLSKLVNSLKKGEDSL